MKPVGVLLAAGNSARFGSNKLAYRLNDGETIGLKSARRLISVLDECVAVVRQTDTQLKHDLTQLGYNIITQPDPQAGMGNSLALAIHASDNADGWLIALADMPWIKTDTFNTVINSLKNGATISAPCFHGQRGHPVAFSSTYRDQLLALQGDTGARSLLAAFAERVTLIEVDDAGIMRDIDRREDLKKFANNFSDGTQSM